MSDLILGASLMGNLAGLVLIAYLFFKNRDAKKQIEIKYFEYVEDVEGPMRDSKRVTIKGQVFVDNVPIGGQYVVAEKSFKKFDYEKLKVFKNEVIEPFAKAGLQIAQAMSGIPDAVGSKGIAKVVKYLKLK